MNAKITLSVDICKRRIPCIYIKSTLSVMIVAVFT